MLKLSIILLVLCISVNQIYSQVDPAFCSSTLSNYFNLKPKKHHVKH